MRVCQFRHFGECFRSESDPHGSPFRKNNSLFYRRFAACQTNHPRILKTRNNFPRHLVPQAPPDAGTTYNIFQANPLETLDNLMPNISKMPPETVSRLRSLAHDLSNSIETIMQASYLLSQLKLESTAAKWVTMIEDAAQDAAHVNREIREVLRTRT